MTRLIDDWLNGYIDYAENSEPPAIYHLWVGISMIAAALQRKVYTDLGFETLFPNMYIILVGPSGCRKSTSIRIGTRLLAPISTIKVGSQATTREMLIQDMAQAIDSFPDPSAPEGISFQNAFTQISSEFHAFLKEKRSNKDLLVNLTDWYDCESPWVNRTKNMGVDKIDGLCLNILAATAPQWIGSMLPEEAIGGGFTARCIFVVAFAKAKLIANPKLTQKQLMLEGPLASDLGQIHLISGEYRKSEEAQAYYETWYNAQGNTPALRNPKFASYCERRGAHVHKLSMILTASHSDKLLIELPDLQRAVKILEATEVKMESAFTGIGENRYIRETEDVMRLLEVKGIMTNRELMDILYRDVDQWTLTIVLRSLKLMGKIKLVEQQEDGVEVYEWIKEEN